MTWSSKYIRTHSLVFVISYKYMGELHLQHHHLNDTFTTFLVVEVLVVQVGIAGQVDMGQVNIGQVDMEQLDMDGDRLYLCLRMHLQLHSQDL